jgi:hypothetical protein
MEPRFSQRLGITPLLKDIQLETIDQDLKNGLWNIYDIALFSHVFPISEFTTVYGIDFNEVQRAYIYSLWHDFFKWVLDTTPQNRENLRAIIKEWYFKVKWYDIYNLIEFSFNFLERKVNSFRPRETEAAFNKVLEREFSGYRFIEGIISPVTNIHELTELKNALSNTNSFSILAGSNIHLEEALRMLSDRLNPDYRNSIKESISAVESLSKVISGQLTNRKGDSLKSAIDRIKGKLKINKSLEQGLNYLYNYTSSEEEGIRHGMMDEPNCDFEDAKFMLISCSAFINYLIMKANKAGIEFKN